MAINVRPRRQPIMDGADLVFHLDGAERLRVPLEKVARRIGDLREFWREYWGPAFFELVQQNFSTEGGLVGGWRALSPRYAAWKIAHFGRLPILQLSRAMQSSFNIGARNNVFKVTKTRVEAGSRDRKVPYHQAGTNRMPKRRIVTPLPSAQVRRLLNQYLRDQMDEAGLRRRA